jgi:hypothetical protein
VLKKRKRIILFFSIISIFVLLSIIAYSQEVVNARTEYSKTIQNADTYTSMTTIYPLHYLDNGEWQDISIDYSVINDSKFDGFTADTGNFQYYVGMLKSKGTDGWTGFGRNSHYVYYRLDKVGYIYYPNMSFSQLGNNPVYNRSNINKSKTQYTAEGTWSKVFSLPSSAEIFYKFYLDGNEFKQNVHINSQAMSILKANPPTTDYTDTYFVLVYEIVFDNVPNIYINQTLQIINNSFDSDNDNILLKDVSDNLIATLPIDEAYILNDTGGTIFDGTLKRRIYQANNNTYMIVGMRYDTVAGLPAGELIFDPTISYQIGASIQDAHEDQFGNMYLTQTAFNIYTTNMYGGLLWRYVTIPQNSVIQNATIELVLDSSANDKPDVIIRGELSSNPINYTNKDYNISQRTRTSNYSYYKSTNLGAPGVYNTTDISQVIQELVDNYDYTYGRDLAIDIIGNDSSGNADFAYNTYNAAPGEAPILYITYTVPTVVNYSINATSPSLWLLYGNNMFWGTNRYYSTTNITSTISDNNASTAYITAYGTPYGDISKIIDGWSFNDLLTETGTLEGFLRKHDAVITGTLDIVNSTTRKYYGGYFDGNDYVTVAHSNEFNISSGGNLTMAVIFNTTNNPGSRRAIINKRDPPQDGFNMWQLSDSKIECTWDGDTGSRTLDSTSSYNDGNFHIVVCRKEGTNLTMWIDGTLDKQASTNIGEIANTRPLYFGLEDGTTNKWIGTIWEIGLTKEAVSNQIIQAIGSAVTNESVSLINRSKGVALSVYFNHTLKVYSENPDISVLRVMTYTNMTEPNSSNYKDYVTTTGYNYLVLANLVQVGYNLPFRVWSITGSNDSIIGDIYLMESYNDTEAPTINNYIFNTSTVSCSDTSRFTVNVTDEQAVQSVTITTYKYGTYHSHILNHIGDTYYFDFTPAHVISVLQDAGYEFDGELINLSITQINATDVVNNRNSVNFSLNQLYITYNCTLKPTTPTITYPANNSVITNSTLTLQWNGTDPNGAGLTYYLYINETNPPTTIYENSTNTSYNFTGTNGIYYARVRSDNDLIVSNYSDVVVFTINVNAIPNTPNITYPANGSKINSNGIEITYNTTDVDNDTLTYEVYLDNNETPTTLVQNNSQTLYNYTGVDGIYYVRVRAFDNISLSNYSDTIMFEKDTLAPSNILNLTNTSQSSSAVGLEWLNPLDSDLNHTEIYYNQSDGVLVFSQNVSGNSSTVSGLSSNTWYTFSVRPVDDVNNLGNYTTITVRTLEAGAGSSGGSGGQTLSKIVQTITEAINGEETSCSILNVDLGKYYGLCWYNFGILILLGIVILVSIALLLRRIYINTFAQKINKERQYIKPYRPY